MNRWRAISVLRRRGGLRFLRAQRLRRDEQTLLRQGRIDEGCVAPRRIRKKDRAVERDRVATFKSAYLRRRQQQLAGDIRDRQTSFSPSRTQQYADLLAYFEVQSRGRALAWCRRGRQVV